jgi:hypothetical protein
MRSPKQVELPPWTAQFVCVAPYLILSTFAVGIVCGRDIAPTLFVPAAYLCLRVTRWVLRVPGDEPATAAIVHK